MLDPFKLLGVDRNATEEEIKRAYYKLAKKYHPDHLPEEMKEEYVEHFLRITWAYKILIDKEKREEYLRDVALGKYEHESEKQKRESREKLFKEGSSLLRKHPARAEKYLKMAYMLDKGNPVYQSYYGLVLVYLRKIQEGISLMQKALDGDPKNVDLFLNLAEGFIEAGNPRKAKAYIKHASRIDKKNPRINRLLERLNKRR